MTDASVHGARGDERIRTADRCGTNETAYVIGAAQIDLLNLLLAHGEYAQADALVDRWATRIDHEISESIRAKIARAGGGS